MSGTNPFPPNTPTSLQQLAAPGEVGAGAYVYEEYSDDDNVRAFFTAYNTIVQQYLSWFANVALPVWSLQSGASLDWVANGLYGLYRPTLTFGQSNLYAAYGQIPFGNLIPGYGGAGYGQIIQVETASAVPVTDDLFQRIMTWHLYRGDGWQFNTRWLKRRIHRFLNGAEGVPPAVQDNTYDVSVTSSGAAFTITLQGVEGQLAIANLFALCVANGVLALPFQYTFTVVLQTGPLVEPIYIPPVTRNIVVGQEQPWHPASQTWHGSAHGYYVPLASHVVVGQEQPWHPPTNIWRGSASGTYIPPFKGHVVVGQEVPWHPAPRTVPNAPGGRFVGPNKGHVVVGQEQPWHPLPVTSPRT